MLKNTIIGILIVAGIVALAVTYRPKSAEPVVSVTPAESTAPTESVTPSMTPSASPAASVSTKPIRNNMHEITIKTNYGDIVLQTYDADAPKTSENFVSLAKKGFYNGVIFHRVIKGFMIQGGDPTGTGTGGPGYQFEDELNANTESYKRGYVKGTVAMANAGPDTNGSQFFIMHQDYGLPHNYTIFGHVVRGQDVVDKIASLQTDANDKPVTPVTMKSVTVVDLK
jgi:cyclophilin family peptidyl-prolyl cis-trans isomerase